MISDLDITSSKLLREYQSKSGCWLTRVRDICRDVTLNENGDLERLCNSLHDQSFILRISFKKTFTVFTESSETLQATGCCCQGAYMLQY